MAGRAIHFQILWARERLGEMDAAMASLRRQGRALSVPETARLAADRKKHRDRFASAVKGRARKSEATWRRARALLEREWKGFEKDFHRHVSKASRQLGLRQSAFQRLSGAQAKAWRGATDMVQRYKDKIVPRRRRDVAAILTEMKTEARQAQARAKKLGQAGQISWSVMRSALACSRRAFDRAHRDAGKAIRRAMK